MTYKRPRSAESFKEFSIDLIGASAKEKEFSFFFLGAENKRKRALVKHFEQKFSVHFQKHETGDYIGTSIKFTCLPEKAESAIKGYSFLFNEFLKGTYINKELITQAAALAVTGYDNDDILPTPTAQNDNETKDNFKGLRSHYNGKSNNRNSKPRYNAAPPNVRTYALEAKTDAQKDLINKINNDTVIFGVGPAGTGKTHIMVAKAVEALKNGQIKKIMLARPAISNGADLGALPGALRDKLAPFMRPLYDELESVMGSAEAVEAYVETGIIEIVPVEMMRGRTFKDAFVIVDEAQNCTQEQMRMALTRIGEGSKMGVTGDAKQIDLKNKEDSGLQWAVDKLEGLKDVAVQYFTAEDVVRAEIVSRIVTALDADLDEKQALKHKKNTSKPNLG